jgi:hypothetical protein
MTAPLSILLFGRDHRLLETRRWVLESAGYRAKTATEREELEHLLATECFAVLILCHTLSEADAEAAIALAHAGPSPRCLSLAANDLYPDFSHPVARMSARSGPATLLATVQKLTESVATSDSQSRA